MDPYVIVGAGLAGAKAAETLRAEGFDGPVVLIGDEDELPYERPPLSKGYLLGKDPREGSAVHTAGWYGEQSVDLRLGSLRAGQPGADDHVRVHDVPLPHLTRPGGRARPGRTDQ